MKRLEGRWFRLLFTMSIAVQAPYRDWSRATSSVGVRRQAPEKKKAETDASAFFALAARQAATGNY
ncbi:MAG: hypothetical protein M3Y79_07585 [Pseudomonadota bacterium]|jgi:hypothetical protein|nr:hypothetical protein [Pseudomonadota bacterium]